MTFFNLVDALKLPGCGLCRLVNGGVRQYFDSTLYEYVNDPKARTELVAAQGFCLEHATDLLTFGDPLGSALLHETLLQSISSSPSGFLTQRAGGTCPACAQREKMLNLYGKTLLDGFHEVEVRAAIQNGGTICMLHLRWMAHHVKDKAILHFLEEYARTAAGKLLSDVEAFAASQNATGLPFDLNADQKISSQRAIVFVSGTK